MPFCFDTHWKFSSKSSWKSPWKTQTNPARMAQVLPMKAAATGANSLNNQNNLRKLEHHDYALPVGSLETYIHWANKIPMLTLAEEQELTKNLYENNDVGSARRLVLSHLRLVNKIARGYINYGLPQADLIQEGNIGLMKAVKRFNPEVGVRLVSFAIHWIRAEIHEYVIRNWRMVKIATTKAQRKLFFNLRRASKKLGWLSADEIKVVSEELNVKEKDVRQMEARMSNYDESFDGILDASNDENWSAPMNILEDNSFDPARLAEEQDQTASMEDQLRSALTTLDERSRDILESRWLNEDKKLTLHDLAAKYKISAERVRQLEKQAMQKLRGQIEV